MNSVDINGNPPPRLILFDGVCSLCNGLVQFIIARDPGAAFTFTALQSEAGQRILRRYDMPVQDFQTFVYIRHGKVYLRSTAALQVLRDIGGVWTWAYVFIVIPVFIRDVIYDRIAKSRYRIWGKRDSCMIPTPELKDRFI